MESDLGFDADLSKINKLAEGKTKEIYEIVGMNKVLIRSKDQITAFNAQRKDNLEGKAKVSNFTTCRVFEFLNDVGFRTHFIKRYSDTEFIAKRCVMIPIEWVARRIATGSFLKRNAGVQEGLVFTPPKLEIFYKDDAANDPQWTEEMLIASGLKASGVEIGADEVELMSKVTIACFEVLERAWSTRKCTLVDMKIEFGVDVESGNIILADVIDSDSWRLWPHGDKRLQVDKQYYRDLPTVTPEALAELKHKFAWASEQLTHFITPPKCRVVVLMGSLSDKAFCKRTSDACDALDIPCVLRVTSAHKGPTETLKIIAEYEGDGVATVFVCVAGGSNGLGPVAAGATTYPVINCPPLDGQTWGAQDVWSSLRVPSGLGCCTVISPEEAAMCAAKMLALGDHVLWSRMRVKKLINYIVLYKGDKSLRTINEEMDAKFVKLARELANGADTESIPPPQQHRETATNGKT